MRIKNHLEKTVQVGVGGGVVGHFKQWLRRINVAKNSLILNLKYLKEVPYDVLEVLHIIVRPVDVIEPRNLNQPSVVVAVHVVADRPGF